MSNRPVCLAHLTPTRYFARTEQTIFFCWDKASLPLSALDFVEMADFLTAACSQLQSPPMGLGNCRHCLLFEPDGCFQICLFGHQFCLQATEMNALLDLLAAALNQFIAEKSDLP